MRPRIALALAVLWPVVACGGGPSEIASVDPTVTTAATTTTTEPEPSTGFVAPGLDSEDLSARQQQMLEVLQEYVGAWQAKDGEAAASFMTDDAVFVYYEQDEVYAVRDGSLQARISGGPYTSMRTFEPVMVYDDRIVVTGTVDAVNVRWLSVINFTQSGEVKIETETVFFGPARRATAP
ncbi:MAG: hypothetical protein PVJ28_06860 [Acidimicrobiia bacterium]